jgi:hypothetical protein
MAWISAAVLGTLGAAALSGGTSLVGSILNYKSQEKANEINERASDRANDFAEKQFAYNQYVNSNKYQIETADMQAAGLNPAMASGNGSTSSLSYQSPNVVAPNVDLSGISNFISDAYLQYKQLKSNEQVSEASNDTALQVADMNAQVNREKAQQEYNLALKEHELRYKQAKSDSQRQDALAEAEINKMYSDFDKSEADRYSLLRETWERIMSGGTAVSDYGKMAQDISRLFNMSVGEVSSAIKKAITHSKDSDSMTFDGWINTYFPRSLRSTWDKVKW